MSVSSAVALRLLTLVALFASAIMACGITTHIEIGHRALDFFDAPKYPHYKEAAVKHQDAFQAGNVFPDAMYNSMCKKGKFHSVAETAHWAPFQNATANYIRRQYPKPWSEETFKLIAFVFGFVSHSVADVSWHSLGIQLGFLRAMGDENFYGQFEDAHHVGDPGGDVMANFELNLEFIKTVGNWYVPAKDLAAIFTDFYGKETVSSTIIDECMAWMFLGRLGERLAIAKVWPKYAHESPFLVEEYERYFLGGVDDMAAWTSFVWHDTITMIEEGTDHCNVPQNPFFMHCNATAIPTAARPRDSPLGEAAARPPTALSANPQQQFRRRPFTAPAPGWNLSLRDVKFVRDASGGTSIEPTAELLARIQDGVAEKRAAAENAARGQSDEGVRERPAAAPSASLTLTSATTYADLGLATAHGDFNGDHLVDLAVSAPGHGEPGNPQHGRVYIVYGKAAGAAGAAAAAPFFGAGEVDVAQHADVTLEGTDFYGRFGSGLAVVDLNADGVDDLAVSAPNVGGEQIQYTGKAFVFFGKGAAGLSPEPSVTLLGNSTYHNLGMTLCAGDLDRDGHLDLVLGSPFAAGGGRQRGEVWAVLSSKRHAGPTVPDLVLRGEQDFEWFGFALDHLAHSGASTLLVGAPGHKLCARPDCSFSKNDTQAVGALYGFRNVVAARAALFARGTRREPVRAGVAAAFALVGNEAFAKLGQAVAAGVVMEAAAGGLGAVVAVAAPTATAADGRILGVHTSVEQAGAVYVFELGALRGSLSLPNVKPSALMRGDRKFGRFGLRVGLSAGALWVGAPLRTSDITEELLGAEQGAVYVFGGAGESGGNHKFPSGEITADCGTVLPSSPCPHRVASRTLQLGEDRARFGSNVLAIPDAASLRAGALRATVEPGQRGAAGAGAGAGADAAGRTYVVSAEHSAKGARGAGVVQVLYHQ